MTANVGPDNILNEVDDANLEEELRACYYLRVDSELEWVRHKVLDYTIENLNATLVDENRDHFLNNSKCAAKLILVFEFILKNIEDESFRYFYAHENNTLLDC